MARDRWSRLAFRALLRLYPRDFRQRFGRDLEADFLEFAANGWAAAWKRTLADLGRAVPLTHTTAQQARDRHARIGGGLASVDNMLTDLRLAVRTFWKSPGYSGAAILTLALGIGVTLAVYSLFHAALVQTLPVREPTRVVQVYTWSAEGDHYDFSYPLYVGIRDRASTLQGLAAYLSGTVGFMVGDRSERLAAEFVTSNYFPLLGVQMRLGPGLTGADERRGGRKSVVISHQLWQTVFAGSADAIGRAVSINGQPFTVVGVAPPGFSGIVRGQHCDLWISVSQFFPLRKGPDLLDAHDSSWLSLIGRLAAGVTEAQAQQELTSIVRHVASPEYVTADYAARVRQASAGDLDLVQGLGTPLRLLMATVGLILLIACANVAVSGRIIRGYVHQVESEAGAKPRS